MAYRTGLENRSTRKGTQGSNPCLSAHETLIFLHFCWGFQGFLRWGQHLLQCHPLPPRDLKSHLRAVMGAATTEGGRLPRSGPEGQCAWSECFIVTQRSAVVATIDLNIEHFKSNQRVVDIPLFTTQPSRELHDGSSNRSRDQIALGSD